ERLPSHRWQFTMRRILSIVVPIAMLTSPPAIADDSKLDKVWVFIGTYTGPKSKGIYRCELDLNTGKLSEPEVAAQVASPSFLAVHPSQKFLYAVGEMDDFAKKKQGAVTAFSLDPKTGKLTQRKQQAPGGRGRRPRVVDKAGRSLRAATYWGGGPACLPIEGAGSLRSAASVVQHGGQGANPARQEKPHAHSINLDA